MSRYYGKAFFDHVNKLTHLYTECAVAGPEIFRNPENERPLPGETFESYGECSWCYFTAKRDSPPRRYKGQ